MEQQQRSLKPIPLTTPSEAPLVSVLIANYNYERFLRDAIESALAQTYSHKEIVVCDDGSTDGSLSLLEEIAADNEAIRVIRQDNRGQAAALSAAFEASKGEIISLLDADDYMRADKLEKIVGAFRNHPDCGMVVHQMMRVDQNKTEQGIYPMASALPEGWLGPAALDAGGYVPWIEAGIMSLRREIARRIFPLPREARQFSDVILRGAGAVLAPIVAVAEPLAFYRLHGANVGNTARRFGRSEMLEHRRRDLEELQVAYSALARVIREATGLSPAAFETTRPYLERRYVIAHLANEPRSTRRALLDKLLSRPEAMSPRLRLFYRLSPMLPRPLFKGGLELVLGQGRLKSMAAKMAATSRRA